jgi:hypothetical protein
MRRRLEAKYDAFILSPKRGDMKRQKALSLLQLLIELAITLFIAGIVVPSLLRSGVSTNGVLAGGSLHTSNIAGVTFLFTYKNIGFAILGVLVGATAAFVIEMERPTFWRSHLSRVIAHEVFLSVDC